MKILKTVHVNFTSNITYKEKRKLTKTTTTTKTTAESVNYNMSTTSATEETGEVRHQHSFPPLFFKKIKKTRKAKQTLATQRSLHPSLPSRRERTCTRRLPVLEYSPL